MKSLSLSRPLVITVIGQPGSGKSFFARQFAEMFGAPLVSYDFLRHTIFPDSQYSPDEDKLVGSLGHEQTQELMRTGKTIIVDGGMNTRAARAELDKLLKKHNYGTLAVWVQTDEPTCRARSLKRSKKRNGDALNTSMDEKAFVRYARQFNAPVISDQVIVISGKHTFASQAKIVLRKLVTPRDPAAPPPARKVTDSPDITEPPRDVQPRRHNLFIN